jgi:RNA polymerase sigma-70 factor (ECF subfamily)
MRLLSDEELARQSQAGSFGAFEELVFRYEGRIYGFVFNSCRNAADAREITQDAFVRAFQAIAQFDSRQAFASWLFTIARRKCIDRQRSAPPVSDELVPDQLDPNDPAEALAQQEDRQGLWDLACRRLPLVQFQALWLRYVEDMPVAEIAVVLRRTKTHVKVLLFRARTALGRELKAAQVPPAPAVVVARAPGGNRHSYASRIAFDSSHPTPHEILD